MIKLLNINGIFALRRDIIQRGEGGKGWKSAFSPYALSFVMSILKHIKVCAMIVTAVRKCKTDKEEYL